MQLFVKTVGGQTLVASTAAEQTIAALKSELALSGDLFFAGQQLDEECTLGEYTLYADATIHETLPVEGGKGKKKKKKNFAKPKKPTHRHKNVPMRVLKYYAVSGDGENEEYKVEHLRTECPHPQCRPGVFMAKHEDGRQTCGKCSLTFIPQKNKK